MSNTSIGRFIPNATFDETLGYEVGDVIWIGNTFWKCADNSEGAAIWVNSDTPQHNPKVGDELPLSNTVWVNLDLTENNIANRIFKTYEEAVSWINDNGSLSSSNRWLIKANVLDSITLYDNIVVHAVSVTTVINERDNNNATALLDDIKRIGTYNINWKDSYLFKSYINSFLGNGKVYGYLLNIGTVVTATDRVYILHSCQISSIQSTHNSTTSLYNCQIEGTTTLSLGSISAYNCQFADIITQSGGSLDARACQGDITQSDGTLQTYNHQGTITRTGGTWVNEGASCSIELDGVTYTDTVSLLEAIVLKISEQ